MPPTPRATTPKAAAPKVATPAAPAAARPATAAAPTAAPKSPTGVAGGAPKTANSRVLGASDRVQEVAKATGATGAQGQAVLGAVTSPLRNREIKRTKQAYQESAQAGISARQSASATLAFAAQLQGAFPEIAVPTDRLKQRLVTTQQASERRRSELAKLTRSIRLSYFFVIYIAVVLAIIADLLSIGDLGWIIAWLIPVFTFFMSRRINKINKGMERIGKTQEQVGKEITLVQQRLQNRLPPGQRSLARKALNAIAGIVSSTSSYIWAYLAETVVAQLIELIPAVDILPFYCAEVAIVLFDQYNAYTKARGMLPGLQRTLTTLEQLETFEIASMTRDLEIVLGLYQQQLAVDARLARQIQEPPGNGQPKAPPKFIQEAFPRRGDGSAPAPTPKAPTPPPAVKAPPMRDITAPVSLPAAA